MEYKCSAAYRQHYRDRYKANRADKKCPTCGVSLTSTKYALCESCREKHLSANAKSIVKNKRTMCAWCPTKWEVLPDEENCLILITDSEGEVYPLEKSINECWLDLFDNVIAWRDLPKAYEVNND